MDKHIHKNITNGNVCSITKCSCGIYHIHYQFVTLKLNQEGLIQLVKIYDRWVINQSAENAEKEELPIKIGMMILTIPGHEVADFFSTVQEAIVNNIELPDFFVNSFQGQRRN